MKLINKLRDALSCKHRRRARLAGLLSANYRVERHASAITDRCRSCHPADHARWILGIRVERVAILRDLGRRREARELAELIAVQRAQLAGVGDRETW